MIQMLMALCEHHGLAVTQDPEITELAQRTEPAEVMTDLKENLPGD